MKTQIFKEGTWVEGNPEQGDKFRTVENGTVTRTSYWGDLATPRTVKITKRSFMQRFTQPERIAIRKSDDDIVIDIYEDLKIASFVDLSIPETKQGLDYMVLIGLLGSERVDEMLVDGTEEEKYPGV